MIDDEDDVEDSAEAADRDAEFLDKIAERTEAYRRLLVSISEIADEELRSEGRMMLVAVRTSFRKYSHAELAAINGSKWEQI